MFMTSHRSRREIFTTAAATGVGFLAATPSSPSTASEKPDTPAPSISIPKIALNASTIRGQKLSVEQQIQVAADAGYDGLEPWIGDLRDFVQDGGKLADLRSRFDDAGISMSGAIGFAQWVVDDPVGRAAGLAEARRDMEMVRTLGGTVMAAPPIGAHNEAALHDSGPIPLDAIAQRYRALLDVGVEMGVTPLLEIWGFSPTLSRLCELAYVATAAQHPEAAVLPDFYHIYKGGNDMVSLGMIEASRMPLFHINDYPSDPPLASISDRDRVFPGDGVCPLVETIAMLLGNGFQGTFSLELFNPDYWKRPAEEVAREGIAKSRAVIEQAVKQAVSSHSSH